MWSWRTEVPIEMIGVPDWLVWWEWLSPNLAGRANKAHSRSLGGGFSMSAGISLVHSASSRGFRRLLMFGTVRHR